MCHVIVGTSGMARYRRYHAERRLAPLLRASILIRPPKLPPRWTAYRFWWRRRVLPPGPLRLFHAPFIAIVGCPTALNIGHFAPRATRRSLWPSRAWRGGRAIVE